MLQTYIIFCTNTLLSKVTVYQKEFFHD